RSARICNARRGNARPARIYLQGTAPQRACQLARSQWCNVQQDAQPTHSLTLPKSRAEGGGLSLPDQAMPDQAMPDQAMPDQAMGLAPRRTSAPSRTISRRMRVEAARRQV